MSVKLITYDLNNPGQNYTKIEAKIRSYKSSVRLSESSYAVSTMDDPQSIYNGFKPFLDQNDTFLVLTLNAPYHGQAYDDVNKFLEQYL